MADVEAAIAAAMSAAAPSAPPMSPVIKTEPFSGDAMVIDSETPQPPQPSQPPQSPQSPLKRFRSPNNDSALNGDEYRDEKRVKAEPAADDSYDEIARMVEAVQASVMKEFLSAPLPNTEHPPEIERKPEPTPISVSEPEKEPHARIAQPNEVLETTEREQVNIESALEAVLDQQRSLSRDAEPRPDTLWSNPRDYTRRKHIIPALGALAVDILIALSEQTLEDTVATLTSDSDSEIAKEYGVLRGAFDWQRRQLSHPQVAPPFLDADKLGIEDQTREVIRIANLASTCASIFGTNGITLEEVNKHFLRIFVPEGRTLTHDAAELYLGLKTQLFLAVLEGDLEKTKDQLLQELFVTDVERSLQAHHPNIPLTITEHDFVANSKARKMMLSNASALADSISTLSKQFTYEAFLDNLSTYLNDNILRIQAQVSGKIEEKVSSESPGPVDDSDAQDLTSEFDLNAAIAEASRAAAQGALQPSAHEAATFDDLSAFLTENVTRAVEQSRQADPSMELPSSIASAAESASRATALALESIARNQYHPTALPQPSSQTQSSSNHHSYQPQPTQTSSHYFPYQQQQQKSQQQQQQQQQQQPQQQQHQTAASMPTNYQTQGDHLPPNQTDSTPALYERARQAAAARSSTHARREGSHSTRRPWSPEEEKALMMGLDMVKGPHWSQILSLFGPNGSISQILADRTQVQLKDKARNLKLFFLKTGSEMPYYLQCVTGELKTRAPTQAARKEAEEKARMNSEEHQAHVNGILALAGGLQNNPVQRSSPSRAMPASTAPQQTPNHTHLHQSTPGVLRQPSQPMAASQPPRPVIPAPQPVSLPTLTPTTQQQQHVQPPTAQPPPSLPDNPPVAEAQVKSEKPTVQQEQRETTASESTTLPDHGGLSIEDQALLSLKAAMEGESTAMEQSAAPYIKQEGHDGHDHSQTT
ncbi:telomere repeat binding factor-domain-containing protein [Xylaria sp. FL0043]|nr:telomere repeat binding factor-domain-containing protein [Xylaria sp. FL0043]